MKPVIFEGSATALITPFSKGNLPDVELFGKIIDFQLQNKTDAVVVAGTTGEASTLSKKEHRLLLDSAVKRIKGRIPVIAGAGSNDTKKALYLSQSAEDAGADALLSVTPYYNKTSQKGLIEHYFYIADRTSLPIILYNVPSRTGLNILPETYKLLSEHPNIVAAKEANGNIESIIKTMNLCGDDLTFYSGDDSLVVPVLSVGGKGVISVAANVVPQKVHDMCFSFFEKDAEKAAELQREIAEITEVLFSETNPIPVKKALSLMGYDVGKGRLPLCEMSEKNAEKLEKALKNEGLI